MSALGYTLTAASTALSLCSDSPRLDAELLLCHVLHCTRTQLRLRHDQILTVTEAHDYQTLIARRLTREPIAYLLGQKEFWSLPLSINANVLVPRAETELLVETTLLLVKSQTAVLADLGTGSGAIALALACERPHWQILATDSSEAALAVARSNAESLGFTQVHFNLGHWTEALPIGMQCDAIVSNPPYLAVDDPHLHDSEITHEPRQALVAENAGLGAYQAIIAAAGAYLKPGGYLCFEHGASQAAAICALLEHYGFQAIHTHQDLAGLDRVSHGQKPMAWA